MMLYTDILRSGKRTMNISWTRCLGLTRGRAGVASGWRTRAVQGEANGAVAWVEASELFCGRQPVVRRCRSLAAEQHEQQFLRTIESRSPVRSNTRRSFSQGLTADVRP